MRRAPASRLWHMQSRGAYSLRSEQSILIHPVACLCEFRFVRAPRRALARHALRSGRLRGGSRPVPLCRALPTATTVMRDCVSALIALRKRASALSACGRANLPEPRPP
jgi:hypothetical protein